MNKVLNKSLRAQGFEEYMSTTSTSKVFAVVRHFHPVLQLYCVFLFNKYQTDIIYFSVTQLLMSVISLGFLRNV